MTKKEKVLKFFALMEIKRQVEETTAEVVGEMAAFHNVDAGEIMSGMNFAEMEDAMAGALAEEFTGKELMACLKFFGSPVGKSVLKKLPDFSEKINEMAMSYVNGKINEYIIKNIISDDPDGGEEDGNDKSGGNGTNNLN